MDHLQQLRATIRQYLFGLLALENVASVTIGWALSEYTHLHPLLIALLSLASSLAFSLIIVLSITGMIVQPIRALWQTILHLSPIDQGIAAPQLDKLRIGRELVASLSAQLYQLANVAEHAKADDQQKSHDLSHNFIAQNLPLPMFVLDPAETIMFANDAAAKYVGIAVADMVGKNVYMVLDMSFPSEDTFDTWLKGAKQKSATASSSWERVRLNVRDNHPSLMFDLAAYYNRGNSDHMETILTLFDHTKQYSQDDQAVSFIALSVHELRTPLTLLRGYIEVFEEELEGKIDPELQGFMEKMRSQAEQLMAFVNNILNVARVDDDQLQLRLQEEQWSEVLKSAIQALSLRAKVRGIRLECRLATDLPSVGVDRLSIYEVINNLVDNAIKYSGTSKVIKIDTHLNKEGMIETTVQDFGLGIPTAVMPNLFTKFYRDHRNRAQIGGTGLGLYLSKAIVTAHGGQLWVQSKEGQGSTFGFTLVPYAQLAEEQKHTGDTEITRGAHGWIKNHSLYRR
ncbi:MAG TPA: ATP-binding protein [Candidatus Saccharimonadales bacterium]